MTTISAKTVLRTRNASRTEKVLSTLLLRYPRWLHAEFMTHRAFSRNAASSRAIPVEKQIEAILLDPAFPIHWGKNQTGMQAYEELDPVKASAAKAIWRMAMEEAVEHARMLADIGAHKQVINRILEPFMHITVLVSTTEWENFLELRDHHAAEPHIQMLAREIRKCLEREDDIQTLQPGEWHLPFVTAEDFGAGMLAVEGKPQATAQLDDMLRKLSVARCASTSYKTVDGFDMTFEKAAQLYDKFVNSTPVHASPFEHVAMVDWYLGRADRRWRVEEHHGNFEGFRQLRFRL